MANKNTFDPTKMAGAGMDQLEASEAMPLLKLLQPRCAEIDPDNEDYPTKGIEGAKTGDLVFAREGTILKRPLTVLFLSFRSLYAEWKPKNQGGGMVAHHPLSIELDPRYTKGSNPAKPYQEMLGSNELQKTIYARVMFLDGDTWKDGIMAFTSTNLKHARTAQGQIRRFKYEDGKVQPFVFSRTFLVDTTKVSKDGNTWYEFKLTPDKVLDFKADKDLLEIASEKFQEAQASLPSSSEPKALPNDDDTNVF